MANQFVDKADISTTVSSNPLAGLTGPPVTGLGILDEYSSVNAVGMTVISQGVRTLRTFSSDPTDFAYNDPYSNIDHSQAPHVQYMGDGSGFSKPTPSMVLGPDHSSYTDNTNTTFAYQFAGGRSFASLPTTEQQD